MPELPQLGIALLYREEAVLAKQQTRHATFLDLSAALYDFELTYEVAVLRSLPEYADYKFSNFFLVGRHRPVPIPQRLRVKSLSYESPFHVLALFRRHCREST